MSFSAVVIIPSHHCVSKRTNKPLSFRSPALTCIRTTLEFNMVNVYWNQLVFVQATPASRSARYLAVPGFNRRSNALT